MTSEAATTPHVRTGALLEVRDLEQVFRAPGGGRVHALSGISFDVMAGETFGLVGESGCGKSTAVRAILQNPRPTGGSVRFLDTELTTAAPAELRWLRARMQLVFQDPHGSLDPRWTVRQVLLEPLRVHGVGSRRQREARMLELLDMVGLDRRHADRKPGQLSGGQCQRVGIARALALQPDLVLFDEAVSSLDVSIQAQILNLIGELRRDLALTSVFIAHDLAVVKHVSDRVGVMYLGKLCEIGPTDSIFDAPAHPYTSALLGSVLQPHLGRNVHRATVHGDLPSPIHPPSGCRFRTRCDRADEVCATTEPPMSPVGNGSFVACHHRLTPPAPSPVNLTRRAADGRPEALERA